MSDSASEKTHEATPHRREEARKEGRFARSRDISGVAGTAAVLAVLVGSQRAIGCALEALFVRCHADLAAVTRGDLAGVSQAVTGVIAVLAAPAAIAAAIVGVASGLAQSGARINTKAVALRLDRLNPLPALQRLFSPKRSVVEVLMGLLRVGAVGYVVYRSLLLELPAMLAFARLAPTSSAHGLIDAIVRVVTNALCALALIAALDYAKARFTLGRDLRMSRQEIVDESRQQEGDPKVKGRMRARARAMARRRSLANVKKATVVIANPTHVAVALRYTAADPAPVVVAKGHDEIALQIRAEARRHGIPILENRPLARALDAEVPLGHPIPSAHFAAVARVLAFVFRLRGRRGMPRAS